MLDGRARRSIRVGPGEHLRGNESVVADLVQGADDPGEIQVGAAGPFPVVVAHMDEPGVVFGLAEALVDVHILDVHVINVQHQAEVGPVHLPAHFYPVLGGEDEFDQRPGDRLQG